MRAVPYEGSFLLLLTVFHEGSILSSILLFVKPNGAKESLPAHGLFLANFWRVLDDGTLQIQPGFLHFDLGSFEFIGRLNLGNLRLGDEGPGLIIVFVATISRDGNDGYES
jgi:hypothetical protein